MRKISKEELSEILNTHKIWLYSSHKLGSRADLSITKLSGASLYGGNLSEANLSGADLSGANLYGANLSGADLSYSDLEGADLSEANTCRANLSAAKLSGTNVSGVNFSEATFSLPAQLKRNTDIENDMTKLEILDELKKLTVKLNSFNSTDMLQITNNGESMTEYITSATRDMIRVQIKSNLNTEYTELLNLLKS